jgi:pimeloyl-[acyl-carrier protein] methyl ester esterase
MTGSEVAFRGGLCVESSGEGPPLVLLHGWAMHSGLWGPLVPHLAANFRVHAVDLPGHGRSAVGSAFTLDGVVEAIAAAFADERRPLTVIGWSLGGLLALAWARREPARVARLALVATPPRFAAGGDWPHAVPAATLQRFGDELRVAWKLTLRRFLTLQLHGSDEGRRRLASLRRSAFEHGAPSQQALAGALHVIASCDLREGIAATRQPSIVIAGGRDTLVPPAAGRWLADHLPDSRYAEIAAAAHVPFLSHADLFLSALDGFLDDRTAS